MKKQAVLDILKAVEGGGLTAEEALTKLKLAPIDDMGFAKVDLHRELRQGIAEVIYGQGKTPEQIAAITGSLIRGGEDVVLITRMAPEAAEYLPADIAVLLPVVHTPIQSLPCCLILAETLDSSRTR